MSEMKRAQQAVNRAVRRGELVRPDRCEDCYEIPWYFTHSRHQSLCGHHEDYSKPLEVIWLCSSCHAKRHRANGWAPNAKSSRQTVYDILKGR